MVWLMNVDAPVRRKKRVTLCTATSSVTIAEIINGAPAIALPGGVNRMSGATVLVGTANGVDVGSGVDVAVAWVVAVGVIVGVAVADTAVALNVTRCELRSFVQVNVGDELAAIPLT